MYLKSPFWDPKSKFFSVEGRCHHCHPGKGMSRMSATPLRLQWWGTRAPKFLWYTNIQQPVFARWPNYRRDWGG